MANGALDPSSSLGSPIKSMVTSHGLENSRATDVIETLRDKVPYSHERDVYGCMWEGRSDLEQTDFLFLFSSITIETFCNTKRCRLAHG